MMEILGHLKGLPGLFAASISCAGLRLESLGENVVKHAAVPTI